MKEAIECLEKALSMLKGSLPDDNRGDWDESLSKEDGSQKAANQEKSEKKKMILAALK